MSPQFKSQDLSQQKPKNQSTFLTNNNFALLRGGLIGVAISAFVSWNAGRYSRVGAAFKRWKFARNFILINQKPLMPVVTNYYVPVLDTVMNNFFCFSGQAGIGKSYHFQTMSYNQSGIRPTLYVAFKSSGRDANFQEDLAQQLEYGEDCPGILSQIIRAVKKIHQINIAPYRFWLKFINLNVFFASFLYLLGSSSLQATIGMALSTIFGVSWALSIYFMVPFIVQSFRRSVPLIIFDDLNKIQHLGMLSQIVRYLHLLQNNMANVVLVSSDEQTWSKLRKQPGVKDRLRLRHITYDHQYTAKRLLQIVQQGYDKFMKHISGNKHYQKQVIKSLIKQLIGRRQVTLRRFISILKLNDEEQYQLLVQVLINKKGLTTAQIVQQFTDILYESQMQTMVSNLKTIKRQLKNNITEQQYFYQLNLLKKRGKLSSDNILAPYLKQFNIVRDLRSQYIFNGRFMYTVFNMSILQYQKDMKQFKKLQHKK